MISIVATRHMSEGKGKGREEAGGEEKKRLSFALAV